LTLLQGESKTECLLMLVSTISVAFTDTAQPESLLVHIRIQDNLTALKDRLT